MRKIADRFDAVFTQMGALNNREPLMEIFLRKCASKARAICRKNYAFPFSGRLPWVSEGVS